MRLKKKNLCDEENLSVINIFSNLSVLRSVPIPGFQPWLEWWGPVPFFELWSFGAHMDGITVDSV